MTDPAVSVPAPAFRTAVTVMNPAGNPALCPFFGKCDGILIFATDESSKEFHPNECRTPQSLCDLIVAVKPDRLVCGYIGEAEKQTLRAAGIDGSCACSVDELAECFCDLPEA